MKTSHDWQKPSPDKANLLKAYGVLSIFSTAIPRSSPLSFESAASFFLKSFNLRLANRFDL